MTIDKRRVDGWLHERFSFHWKVDAADPPLGHLTSWESDEGLRMLMKGIFPNFARNTFLADFVQLVVSSVWMVLMIIMVLVLGLMMMITNPIMKFKFKR